MSKRIPSTHRDMQQTKQCHGSQKTISTGRFLRFTNGTAAVASASRPPTTCYSHQKHHSDVQTPKNSHSISLNMAKVLDQWVHRSFAGIKALYSLSIRNLITVIFPNFWLFSKILVIVIQRLELLFFRVLNIDSLNFWSFIR